MKKVTFITQAKGGAGKSVLTFLAGEKYPEAKIFDMDDGTKTTMKQLEYRKPAFITFLNDNKVIDRGLMNSFFEKVADGKGVEYICDLGASISEQLPQYFNDISLDDLNHVLKQSNIDLQIICVIGGQNIFRQCCEYLEQLAGVLNGKIKLKVGVNRFYHLSEEQEKYLADLCKKRNISFFDFTISKDKNLSTQTTIAEVLKSGKGISELSPFKKLYFSAAIETLNIYE